MTNVLSVYYSPHHDRAEDIAYIRQLDPAWVRIHQPTARAIQVVQQAAPNAKIMLRSWDIDDHNGDRKREMYADPRGAARKHLEMWATKLNELHRELQRNGWTYDAGKWHIGLVNEPDPSYVPQVVEYSLAAMRWMETFAIPIPMGVVVSSVGTFSKPSENDRGWTLCMPLEQPINDGGHILIAHEYWQPEGPTFGEDAGNLAWRHQHIPLNVPILIGESGANGYIYGRHSANDDSGWQKTVKDPNLYAAQVKEYIEGCDARVKGVCLYMTDFHSDQWWSFDTLPAMHQLLAIKDARPQKPNPFANKPVETRLPSVHNPTPPSKPATGYVSAPAGVNLRTAPLNGEIITAIPYGEQLRIVGVGQDGWLRVQYAGQEGWASGQYIALEEPKPLPQPEPASSDEGDNWTRSYAFVRRWEGGYQAVHNDRGNWTGGEVGKGELKGTNFGISAASYPYLDIKNLTREQAAAIYRTDYWQASGASELPWPACLIVFDTAVLHGVGTARNWLEEVGTNPYLFAARRLRSYTKLSNWDFWGKAWCLRVADLLEECAK